MRRHAWSEVVDLWVNKKDRKQVLPVWECSGCGSRIASDSCPSDDGDKTKSFVEERPFGLAVLDADCDLVLTRRVMRS